MINQQNRHKVYAAVSQPDYIAVIRLGVLVTYRT